MLAVEAGREGILETCFVAVGVESVVWQGGDSRNVSRCGMFHIAEWQNMRAGKHRQHLRQDEVLGALSQTVLSQLARNDATALESAPLKDSPDRISPDSEDQAAIENPIVVRSVAFKSHYHCKAAGLQYQHSYQNCISRKSETST